MKTTQGMFPMWPGLDMGRKVEKTASETRRATESMVTVIAARMIREEHALRERLPADAPR